MTSLDMPPVETPENESRRVDTFVVLDLDRTLLRTDELAYAMCDMLFLHGISEQDIAADKAKIDANFGQSFSLSDHLIERYGIETLEAIKRDLLQLAESDELRERLLHEGARLLLDGLDRNDIPHAVLTHGDEVNQAFKLELFAKLTDRKSDELHAKITHEKFKAKWIHSQWYDGEGDSITVPAGEFTFEPLVPGKVVILDDKKDNLVSPHENLVGIWIDNTEQPKEGTLTLMSVALQLQQAGELATLASHHQIKEE